MSAGNISTRVRRLERSATAKEPRVRASSCSRDEFSTVGARQRYRPRYSKIRIPQGSRPISFRRIIRPRRDAAARTISRAKSRDRGCHAVSYFPPSAGMMILFPIFPVSSIGQLDRNCTSPKVTNLKRKVAAVSRPCW